MELGWSVLDGASIIVDFLSLCCLLGAYGQQLAIVDCLSLCCLLGVSFLSGFSMSSLLLMPQNRITGWLESGNASIAFLVGFPKFWRWEGFWFWRNYTEPPWELPWRNWHGVNCTAVVHTVAQKAKERMFGQALLLLLSIIYSPTIRDSFVWLLLQKWVAWQDCLGEGFLLRTLRTQFSIYMKIYSIVSNVS